MILLLFVSFFIFLLINLPIAFSIILSTLIYVFTSGGDISWLLVPTRLMRGINNFLFICLPLFVLAGQIMNQGGITKRLIRLAQAFVGPIRGGLAMVNVLVCMLFGGISGSAVAETSAVGSIMIPSMKEEGYSAAFASGLTSVASCMGPIIPPSLAFVLYGAMANVSIKDLFIAGYIPGIMMALGMIILVHFDAVKLGFPRMNRFTPKEIIEAILQSIPCLLLPVLIIGGLVLGWFTPTEAAAVACVYALFLSICYRSITLKSFWESLVNSAIDSASIMLIVGACYILGYAIANEQLAIKLTKYIALLDTPVWIKLAMINIGLLVLGMFMDSAPAILLVTPILAPAMEGMGLNPIHAGMIVCLNLVIGLTTPPVGVCLYTATNLAKVKFGDTIKEAIPFILVSIVVLLLVTYLPFITEIPFKIIGF